LPLRGLLREETRLKNGGNLKGRVTASPLSRREGEAISSTGTKRRVAGKGREANKPLHTLRLVPLSLSGAPSSLRPRDLPSSIPPFPKPLLDTHKKRKNPHSLTHRKGTARAIPEPLERYSAVHSSVLHSLYYVLYCTVLYYCTYVRIVHCRTTLFPRQA